MNISIPDNCKNIAILFSGGMDSTILLYLILEKLQEENKTDIIVKCYIMNTGSHTYENCTKIILKLENIFSRKIYKQKLPRSFIRDTVKKILDFDGGYVFSGCNKVLDNLNPTVYIKGDTPPIRGPAYNEFHIRPFIDIEKSDIAYTYYEKNLVDLLNMTYSCGANFITPCEGCYFCLERAWALGVINI